MEVPRLPDWEQRLITLANDWSGRPYVYGSTDCASFVQAAVEAVTGVVLLPEVERPRGWMAAAKFMIAHGWDTVEDMAGALLGSSIDPALSRRGDVVSFIESEELHLAVRIGDAALSPAATGLIVADPGCWRRAWKIG